MIATNDQSGFTAISPLNDTQPDIPRETELAEARARLREAEEALAAAKVALDAANQLTHEWWVNADRAIREVAALRSTWSWRLTSPFRIFTRLARSIRKRYRRWRGLPPLPGRPAAGRQHRDAPASGERLRFFARQRRSFDKRYRRLRGLPPPPAPVRKAAFATLAPASPAELTHPAQLILRRLNQRREFNARRAPPDRHRP